VSPRFED
jgi:hypothetical protein